MAEIKQETFEHIKTSDAPANREAVNHENHALLPGSQVKSNRHMISRARSESSEEREVRLKMLRDRQNEERQRKIEELKAQALAAQQFRDMKVEERRKRIDELRIKENDRRQQVGERKRLIYEAERDRLESMLKKNQEREQRIEAKRRNDRGSLVFAFGSSTPRMLEPADTGGSFWGHRRATSTSNIMFSAMPLTRRSSERELDGSKKRATSAGGLDRNSDAPEDAVPAAGCVSGHMGRRRTDLMPTIPLRDSATALDRAKRPFTKSPGRTYSMSRLDQLAQPRRPRFPADLPSVTENLHLSSSTSLSPTRAHVPIIKSKMSSTDKSMSRSMSHLTVRKTLSKSDSRSMQGLHQAGSMPLSVAPSLSQGQGPVPVPKPRTNRAVLLRKRAADTTSDSTGPSRPGSSLSQQSTSSVSSTINLRARPITAPRKPRPASIAITGITHDSNKNAITDRKEGMKPPLPRTRKPSLDKVLPDKPERAKVKRDPSKSSEVQSPATEKNVTEIIQNVIKPERIKREVKEEVKVKKENNSNSLVKEQQYDKVVKKEIEEREIHGESKSQPVEIVNPVVTAKTEPPTEITLVEAPQPEPEQVVQLISIEPEMTTPVAQVTESVETVQPVEESAQTPKPLEILPEKAQPIEDLTAKPQIIEKTEISEIDNLTGEKSGEPDSNIENVDMTASMMAKSRITTVEEAKAAIAEKRRLAREEAERKALAEKLRIEQEEERQRQEEEQQRLLAEEQRKAEEERLAQAIREAQKREETERLKKQEEMKQKLEKEEQDRKTKEENEKKKIEMEERLKMEEREREARKKRVEAIMSRTRAKGSPGNQNKIDGDVSEKTDADVENQSVNSNKALINIYEKSSTDKQDALLNGSLKSQWPIINQENGGNHRDSQTSNGHKNGADNADNRRDNHSFIEQNVTNTLMNEFDPFRNTNTSIDLSTNKITIEDNVNSNNPTSSEETRDLLL